MIQCDWPGPVGAGASFAGCFTVCSDEFGRKHVSGIATLRINGLDFRQALRVLRRSPGYSIAVVLSLALGIGATSTIFSIVDAVLLRPLPYARPSELFSIALGSGGVNRFPVPASFAEAWSGSSLTLASIALYNQETATLDGGGRVPEQVVGTTSSPELLGVLGGTPAIGRFLAELDMRAGAEPVIVLSHGFWLQHFGGDSLVVGRSIRVSDKPTTIIGVMRSEFDFPPRAAFWRPLPSVITSPDSLALRYTDAVARVRRGVSATQLQRDLSRIERGRDPRVPKQIQDAEVVVAPLHERLYGSARFTLLAVFAGAALLMLIACANVTSLMLARTIDRRHEYAVRAALGATRSELIAAMLVESSVLALAGGALGFLASIWATQPFVALASQSLAGLDRISASPAVLVFSASLSFSAWLLTGSASVGGLLRGSAHVAIGESDSRVIQNRPATTVRRGLVVGQIALAVTLLVGAGLLLKSVVRLASADLGFNPAKVLVMTLPLPRTRYPTGASAQAMFDEVAAAIRLLPDVQAVTYGPRPLAGIDQMVPTRNLLGEPSPTIGVDFIGAGYFATYGIRIREGREILASDNSGSRPVVVINSSAARLLFPGGGALGGTLDIPSVAVRRLSIVGISDDVAQYEIGKPVMPEAFAPVAQSGARPRTLAVRVRTRPEVFVERLRNIVHDQDPGVAVEVRTLDMLAYRSIASRRAMSLLFGTFAALALVLAGFGLFGLVAYSVAHRTRELCLRMALGAGRRHIIDLVVRECLMLTGIGMAMGIGLALGLARVLNAVLFEVRPNDPTIFAGSALLLAAVAFAAAYIPARHATHLDPMIALRV
jgi:predicted permease